MIQHCPHLGLKDSRDRSVFVAHPDHRCYVAREPERIGSGYQVSTCLSSGYERCPRMATHAPAAPSALPSRASMALPAAGSTAARYTDLQPAGRAKRRRVKPFQFVILGLALSIVGGVFALGYAVYYQHGVEPGMNAPAAVALAEPGPPTVLPTVPPTAMPATVTVARPTSPPATAVPALPTPGPALIPASPTLDPRPPAVLPPTRLVIPKIDLDIAVKPVGPKEVRDGNRTRIVWGDVANAGAFHNTSAYPGNSGNTVINGHRDTQGSVFLYLDQVGVGDEIVVYVEETGYRYQVTEVLIVPETFASAAQRAENRALLGGYLEERLTLVTCTPVGLATHRLVVVARPPDLAEPEMPAAGSDS